MKRLLALGALVALAACADTPTQPDATAVQPVVQMGRTLNNGWYNYHTQIWNECTLEDMEVDGRYHLVIGVTKDQSGGRHYTNSVVINMNVRGLTSGTTYRWHFNRHLQQSYNANNQQAHRRHRLTETFRGGDGTVRTLNYELTLVFNANGEVVNSTFTPETITCG